MAENIGAISGEVRLDSSGFKAGLTGARGGLSSFGKQAAATALGLVGAGSIYAALNTVKQAVTDSIKDFMDFESAMAEVSTLVDTSTVDMNKLEMGVVNLSKKYGQDAGGLANALYQTVSAGIDTADSLLFLEAGVKAAIGGVTDAKTAIDALTSIVNAYGLSASEVDTVSDSLFTTIKLGKTTMDELAGVIGRVAPISAAAGISIDEMTNAIATLTLAGLSTDEAGTAMTSFLMGIIKPAEGAKDAAKLLNMEISVNAMKAAGGFSKYMEIIQEKTGGSSVIMAELLQNKRALNAALILTSEQGLKKFNENIGIYSNKLGAANEATEKMAKTSKVTWGKIGATIADTTKKVGKLFSDMGLAIVKLGGIIIETKKNVKDYSEETGELIHMSETYLDLVDKESKSLEDLTSLYDAANTELERHKNKYGEIIKVTDFASAAKFAYRQNLEGEIKTLDESMSKLVKREVFSKLRTEDEKKRLDDIRIKKEEAHKANKIRFEEEKEKAEEVAKRKEDLLKDFEDFDLQVSENMHQSRLRYYERGIGLLEDEAKKKETLETRKLEIESEKAELRMKIATEERMHAILMLQDIRDKRISIAGEDELLLKKIENSYILTSKKISDDWKERVSKELEIKAEAEFKINQTTWDRLNTNVRNNFEKWASDLESGSTSAWSNLISDTNNAVNEIGNMFGGLPDDVSKIGDSLTGMITGALTGDPVSFALGAFKTGWNIAAAAFGDAGEEARKAAEEEKKAAYQALQAAKAFLKSQDKIDLTLLTFEELQEHRKKAEEEFLKLVVQQQWDWDVPVWERGKVMEDILAGKTVDFGVGATDLETLMDTMSWAWPEVAKTASDLLKTIEGTEVVIGGFKPGGVPTPGAATTFAGARTALEMQRKAGIVDEETFKEQLKSFAIKFWRTLTPQEYQNIMLEAMPEIIKEPDVGIFGERPLTIAEQEAEAKEEKRQKYLKEWLLKNIDIYGGWTTAEIALAATTAVDERIAEEEHQKRLLSSIVGLEKGGIVTKPTMAMLGEAGTEAVIPLTEPDIMESISGLTQPTELNINVDISPDVLDRLNEETAIALSENLGESIAVNMRAGGL